MSPPPDCLVVHLGPVSEGAGGIEAVLRSYRNMEVDGFRLQILGTFASGDRLHSARRAVRAAIWLMRNRRRVALVHVHLSQRGSFLREGGLLTVAHAASIPAVATLHGSDFQDFSRRHPRLTAQVLGRASRVLVLHAGAAEAVQAVVGTPVQELVNPVQLPPHPAAPECSAPRVIFAGAIGNRKGVDVLIEAWQAVQQSVPAAELYLAGPLERNFTPQQFGASGVNWLGELPHSEVSALMKEARVAVLPSRQEAMPVFVLEAMAQGLPVVVSDVGALPSLSVQSGACVPVGNAKALADALVAYLQDAGLAARDGRHGRQRVLADHSLPVVAKRLSSIYRDVLE